MPVWPDSVALEVRRTMRLEAGDEANVTRLSCDVHVGTHVETSLHFLAQGQPIDALPLDLLIGPAFVGHLPQASQITEKELDSLDLPADTIRLLLKTRNSERWEGAQSFRQDYVGLTPGAARWAVERGLRLIGADYLSVAAFSNCAETHRILMARNIVVLEGLNLSNAAPGSYELICLPLKLSGAEAAPARAVLRPLT